MGAVAGPSTNMLTQTNHTRGAIRILLTLWFSAVTLAWANHFYLVFQPHLPATFDRTRALTSGLLFVTLRPDASLREAFHYNWLMVVLPIALGIAVAYWNLGMLARVIALAMATVYSILMIGAAIRADTAAGYVLSGGVIVLVVQCTLPFVFGLLVSGRDGGPWNPRKLLGRAGGEE